MEAVVEYMGINWTKESLVLDGRFQSEAGFCLQEIES